LRTASAFVYSANRTAGGVTTYSVLYRVSDSSSNEGNCTVTITVSEIDRCAQEAAPVCGAHATRCQNCHTKPHRKSYGKFYRYTDACCICIVF
jgi:hypothetical protein